MEAVIIVFVFTCFMFVCDAQQDLMPIEGIAVDSDLQSSFQCFNQTCLRQNNCILVCCLDYQDQCYCCQVEEDSTYRCPPPHRECYTCDPYSCGDDGLDFIGAAKIAILIALCVTFVAVLVAIYRAFIRPRCFGNRSGPRPRPSEARSLNSIQRFVLSRLEDRPPPYEYQPEKPPAYEELIVDGDPTNIPTISASIVELSSSTLPQEPPSYQEALETMLQLDPTSLSSSYSTGVLLESTDMAQASSSNLHSSSGSSDAQSGTLNEGFEFEEIPLRQAAAVGLPSTC